MTVFSRLVALAATLILTASIALAHDNKHTFTVGDLVIHNPWARATPKTARVGAGYLLIENRGTTADRLTGLSSPISGMAQVHRMKVTDGVMRMRKMEGGLDILPGATTALMPGGNHIMFMKLAGPIRKDQPFTATLTFEHAGTVEITFETVGIGKTLMRGSHGG